MPDGGHYAKTVYLVDWVFQHPFGTLFRSGSNGTPGDASVAEHERSMREKKRKRQHESSSVKVQRRSIQQMGTHAHTAQHHHAIDGIDGAESKVRLLDGQKCVRKDELSRVLMAGLARLGYTRASDELERESGHTAETPEWREAEATAIHSADFSYAIDMAARAADSHTSALSAQLPLVREEFLHTLVSPSYSQHPGQDNNGHSNSHNVSSRVRLNAVNAICLLQQRATSCMAHSESIPRPLERLTSLVMCTSADEVAARAHWGGPSEESRKAALAEARKNLPPSSVLPETRLEELLSQALDRQTELADDFNDELETLPLLYNVCGSKNSLPTAIHACSTKHSNEVWHVCFSLCGTMLATGGKDGKALVFSLGSEYGSSAPLRRLPQMQLLLEINAHRCDVNTVAFSPCSNYLATCGAADKQAHVYCTKTGKLIKSVGRHSDAVVSLVWVPDCSGLMTGGLDKVTSLFKTSNIVNGAVDDPPPSNEWVGGRPHDLAIGRHISGRFRAIACCSEATIKLWWITRLPRCSNLQQEEHIRETTGSVCSLAMSKDLKQLAVTLPTLEVHVFDVSCSPLASTPLQRFRAHASLQQARFVLRSAFGGRDESFIATGGDDSLVYIWRRSSSALVACLNNHSGSVNAVAWHPNDPAVLATASDDQSVCLWISPNAQKSREQHQVASEGVGREEQQHSQNGCNDIMENGHQSRDFLA